MSLFWRQIRALVRKDLLLLWNRKSFYSTITRAFYIPLIFIIYMTVIIKVYFPKEYYGIGSPTQIRPLQTAMDLDEGGRNTLVFVNGVSSGGDIDHVIQLLSQSITSPGKTVKVLTTDEQLRETCRSTLQGTTKCYGAVVFNSSPKEGPYGIWNYTIRSDAGFGSKINVSKSTNDAEIYILPLQHAVDAAISSVNSTKDAVALPAVDEYRMYHNFIGSARSNISQFSHRKHRKPGQMASSSPFRK